MKLATIEVDQEELNELYKLVSNKFRIEVDKQYAIHGDEMAPEDMPDIVHILNSLMITLQDAKVA